MNLLKTISFIINHPFNRRRKFGALKKFIYWQINTRINPYPVIFNFTSKSKLIAWRGLTGATGNIYCGLHEFEDMAFLLHFLRSGDLFVDIGANIGSYSILAAAHVGAETISFEPIPSTFNHLVDNIKINHIDQLIDPRNKAIGSDISTLRFTKDLDTVNHVATAQDTDTIEIPVNSLDHELKGRSPNMIKIDVEGFENEVIKGGVNTLKNSVLSAVILELNGSGKRYGFNDEDIHSIMISLGYQAYKYEPFNRDLTPLPTYGNFNTLYLKNIELISHRLKTADKAFIQGQMI